jgi:hypothetical protein
VMVSLAARFLLYLSILFGFARCGLHFGFSIGPCSVTPQIPASMGSEGF